MTPLQIAAVIGLVVVGGGTYVVPLVKPWLAKIRGETSSQPRPSSMQQVEAVLSIRDSSSDKEVVSACNALLHALLKVTT